jgi:hypothetical protein
VRTGIFHYKPANVGLGEQLLSHLLKTTVSSQTSLLKRINKNAMKLAALPAE